MADAATVEETANGQHAADVQTPSFLSEALDSIRQVFERHVKDRDESSKAEIERLSEEISVLSEKAARVDSVLHDNQCMRHALDYYIRDNADLGWRVPFVDPGSAQTWIVDGYLNGHGPIFKDVPLIAYRAMYDKCEKMRKELDLAKRQGGNYKKSYEKYKDAYNKLKVKRQDDKAAILTWQTFSDGLEKKVGDARATTRELSTHSPKVDKQSLRRTPLVSSEITMGSSSASLISALRSGIANDAGQAVNELGRENGTLSERVNCGENISNAPPCSPYVPSALSDRDQQTPHTLQDQVLLQDEASLAEINASSNYENSTLNSSAPSDNTRKTLVDNPTVLDPTRSSQTTDDEAEVTDSAANRTFQVEADLSSDPIVVSSRILKRKRSPDKNDTRKNAKTITVKEESNSSPLNYAGLARLFHGESLDLDEYSRVATTPHKTRQLDEALLRKDSQPSTEELPVATPPNVDSEASAKPSREHVTNLKTDFKSSVPKPKAGQFGNLHPTSFTAGFDNSNRPRTEQKGHGNSTVLQPLSPNLQNQRRPRSKNAKKAHGETHHGYINELAEDGEHYEDPSGPAEPQQPHQNEACNANPNENRLNQLLETPAPGKSLLTPHTISHQPRQKAQNPTRAVPSSENPRQTPKPQTPAARAPATDPGRVRPDEEPLRARPLHRLDVQDFKVNPAANNGLAYPFAEAVRGQDRRRCLPGCTREECCGGRFRKMAELGGVPAPARRLWDAPSQDGADDDDPEQRLLEEYLGTDSGLIATLGPAERREMVLRAKTERIANLFGKHRQGYRRARTPPGYWRTDFPTTQEDQADKVLGKQLERELVEERYREALKPNGRWMFRDE